MKICLVNALVIVLVLSSGMNSAPAASLHQKPMLPPVVSIHAVPSGTALQDIKPGDVVELIIQAQSPVEDADMSVTVDLLEGAAYVSGTRQWKGSVAKNHVQKFTISVRAPEADRGSGKVRATVAIVRSGTVVLKRSTLFYLGAAPKGPQGGGRNGVSKKDAKGRDIVEH